MSFELLFGKKKIEVCNQMHNNPTPGATNKGAPHRVEAQSSDLSKNMSLDSAKFFPPTLPNPLVHYSPYNPNFLPISA